MEGSASGPASGPAGRHRPPAGRQRAPAGRHRPPAGRRLALVTVLVPDYDEAVDFFAGVLGFSLVEDSPQGDGRRRVVVVPGGGGAGLLLARAAGDRQQARVGDQTGGRVAFFLDTDDVDRDVARLAAAGCAVEGPVRDEPFGRATVFRDPWGNRWDLVQRQPATG